MMTLVILYLTIKIIIIKPEYRKGTFSKSIHPDISAEFNQQLLCAFQSRAERSIILEPLLLATRCADTNSLLQRRVTPLQRGQ